MCKEETAKGGGGGEKKRRIYKMIKRARVGGGGGGGGEERKKVEIRNVTFHVFIRRERISVREGRVGGWQKAAARKGRGGGRGGKKMIWRRWKMLL